MLDLFFGGGNLMLLLIIHNSKNESLVFPNPDDEIRNLSKQVLRFLVIGAQYYI